MDNFNKKHSPLIAYSLVVFLILVVFHELPSHDFLNFDDNIYITENNVVQQGLTLHGITLAFTTIHANFWHPITWIAHMLDCELFGMNPGMHHFTSLVYHILNSVLLLLVLHNMTGEVWKSTFVAILFAIHPLHIESVAWASEKKDVVSTLFWMLTLLTYFWYVKKPGYLRYIWILLSFALGLMSKPMIVTLPCVLLLLDYWPLKRFEFPSGHLADLRDFSRTILQLISEKIPLFLLAAIVSFLAVYAQGGAVQNVDTYPIAQRIMNALVSLATYLAKVVFPINLSVFYPYPSFIPLLKLLISGLVLVSITIIAIWQIRKFPYIFVGWMWFIGTLIPVSGIIQVGDYAMADRFTYISLTGLCIILAWGGENLIRNLFLETANRKSKIENRKIYEPMLIVFSTLIISALMCISYVQLKHWKNNLTLFSHAVNVTENNFSAYTNLGACTANLDLAEEYTQKALNLKHDNTAAHNNMGIMMFKKANYDKAIYHFSEVLRLDAYFKKANYWMGMALFSKGNENEGVKYLFRELEDNPNDPDTLYNIGIYLAKREKYSQAIAYFNRVLQEDPNYWQAKQSLVFALEDIKGSRP
ncbi:MAG: tetratricopeptide repeat protein [Desulfobacterales bacterium]|nr:tetratricopeptide repeat protein [Desulfobacterales bacterium]